MSNSTTIDGMLEWLDRTVAYKPMGNPNKSITELYADEPEAGAIRAILEESRPMERGKGLLLLHPNDVERRKLKAIRAFVERVEKRIEDALPFTEFADLMRDELAAIEKEQDKNVSAGNAQNTD